jgi:adenine-specific DNA-methyltransferase
MAKLDDIVAEVRDGVLRKKLQDAVADMKKKQRFGLVFEEHIPETTAIIGLPVHVGATVQRRDDPSGRSLYLVKEVNGGGSED